MTTDLVLDKTTVASADDAVISLVMNQILEKAPPVVAEGLFLASTVHSFTVSKFNFLRPHDIERNEKLVQRLAKFSFVIAIEREGQETQYNLTESERDWLQLHWITTDPTAFLNAHRLALDYYRANPDPDDFIQRQHILYHQLIVDYAAARTLFTESFRTYINDRRYAAVERLILTAKEVRPYLVALQSPQLAQFDGWIQYTSLRFRQYRGEWEQTQDELKELLKQPGLADDLIPFLHRAYGEALERTGRYVEAINQLEKALTVFQTLPDSEIEQGYTMFALGEAHVGLATSARGYRELIPRHETSLWQRLRGLFNYPPFPLLLYLSFYFGTWIWHPRSWAVFKNQDWIIARLFAVGANWYNRARSLYQRIQFQAGQRQVQEHLANLYLTLGDARRAEPTLRELLDSESVVSGFRYANIQLALGHAFVRLRRYPEAMELLEKAIPVLQTFDDKETEARAQALMGEALFASGEHQTGIEKFDLAIQLYQKSGDVVAATEVAERVNEFGEDRRLASPVRQFATSTSSLMARRQYMVRFDHPMLMAFRRLMYLFLSVVLFAIPLMVINLDTSVTLAPDINFFAFPFLEAQLSANTLNYGPSLSQAIVLILKPSTDANVFAWVAVVAMIAYFIIYTIVGLLVIIRTPVKAVEAATRAETVRFDMTGFAVGQENAGRRINWHEITHITRANVFLLGQLVRDHSLVIVESESRRIPIRGSTAWYESLTRQIERYAPQSARKDALDYHIGWGRLTFAYGLSLILLTIFAIVVKMNPQLLFVYVPLTPYSVADLYPLLYMGLFLGPMYWGILRPLRIETRARANNNLPWTVLAVIVALGLLRFFIYRRPLLTIPDIYPQLFIVMIAAEALRAIRGARSVTGRHTFSRQSRLGATVAAAFIFLLMFLQLGQDVLSHFFLSLGNWHRDRGIELVGEEQTDAYWSAVTNYNRAIRVAPARWTSRLGIPNPKRFTWVQAYNNRATLYAQLGDFAAASEDYATITRYLPDSLSDTFYASQAIAYESWAADLLAEGNTERATERYWQAKNAFAEAIARRPGNSDYYVWQGVADHNISGDLNAAIASYSQALNLNPENVGAMLGLGWAFYQEAENLRLAIAAATDEAVKADLQTDARLKYQAALSYFNMAAVRDARQPNIHLAVGYAHYALEEYPAALLAWERAAELAPDDPVMIVSRGTGYWRMGTLPSCSSNSATDEQKAQSVVYLEKALSDLDLALSLNPIDAFTYRTKAQIEFILSFCGSQGFDSVSQLEKAVHSYSEAVTLEPNNDLYLIFRGRIGYLWARALFLQGAQNDTQARDVLDQVIADIQAACDIDCSDDPNKQTKTWYDFVVGPTGDAAWPDFHRRRGQVALQAETPDYAQAYADLSYAAPLIGNNLDVAFQAGLAALAQGEMADAAAFYDMAIERMALAQDATNLSAALDAFNAYVQANPTVDLATFYTQFQNDPALQRNSDLQSNDWYWHYRAMFGFTVTRRLFEAGQEDEAQTALEGVKIDIEKAYALNPTANRNDVWRTFFNEGAWGWLYLRRGDTRLAEGLVEGAWADYGAAASLIPASNEVTAADYTEAMSRYNQTTFDLALLVFQDGDLERTRTLYETGITLAQEREDEAIVDAAAKALQDLLIEEPGLSTSAQPFILLLETAFTPTANETNE